MTTTLVFDGLIIRGLPTGTRDGINGTHYQERAVTLDDAGNELFARLLDPVPIDKADPAKLEALFGRLQLGALVQVQDLTVQLKAAQDETKAAQTETKQAQTETKQAQSETKVARDEIAAKIARIEELEAQLAALTAPTVPTVSPVDATLEKLNALFATIPAEVQAQFAGAYAIVRVLIQAGQPALALAVVQGVQVPEALAELKAQIVAALTPPGSADAPAPLPPAA